MYDYLYGFNFDGSQLEYTNPLNFLSNFLYAKEYDANSKIITKNILEDKKINMQINKKYETLLKNNPIAPSGSGKFKPASGFRFNRR